DHEGALLGEADEGALEAERRAVMTDGRRLARAPADLPSAAVAAGSRLEHLPPGGRGQDRVTAQRAIPTLEILHRAEQSGRAAEQPMVRQALGRAGIEAGHRVAVGRP